MARPRFANFIYLQRNTNIDHFLILLNMCKILSIQYLKHMYKKGLKAYIVREIDLSPIIGEKKPK